MKEFEKLHSTEKLIPLSKMRVCIAAQRDLKPARVNKLQAEFDPEMFGVPVVSFRDGHYYIIDGQHRIAALKLWLGNWENQSVTCRIYTGLSEQEEADMFDRLDDALAVSAFDKFKVRVTANRPVECAVKKVVEKCGMKISKDKKEGSVSAVSTLTAILEHTDEGTLARTLIITNHSFGVIGLTKEVMRGISLVCTRYNGELHDAEAIEKLKSLRGGVGQLLSKANLLKNQTHQSLPECVAAAVVDTMNGKRGGKKLPSWWKEQ